jgi:DNA gyrase/topoisomerase IV subunit A
MSHFEQKSITQFLEAEYRDYAMYVIEGRAIPSVIDGLKPTQRKIIHVSNKVWRNIDEKPMKVFQLGGRIASDAFYHHGDASLYGAIIGLAQSFKNNLALLEEKGQFGSLRSPEAGAPRYISTRLSKNFRHLYKDFELLESKFEEGYEIEPEWFLPIIPTVLINGASGIAVGFASNILNRDPKKIIKECLNWLEGKKIKDVPPALNDYKGKYVQDKENPKKWTITGQYEVLTTNTIHITELPPSMTYEKWEDHLDFLLHNKKITGFEDQSGRVKDKKEKKKQQEGLSIKDKIDYTVKFTREELASLIAKDELIKLLKMSETETEIYTTLDENGEMKIFETCSEIINYFMDFRLKFYIKRKEYQILQIEKNLLLLTNRAKFIKMIIDDELIINKRTKAEIEKDLVKNKFDQIEGSYDYLLRMAISSLGKEQYDKMVKEVAESKKELIAAKKLEPREVFKSDLEQLAKEI